MAVVTIGYGIQRRSRRSSRIFNACWPYPLPLLSSDVSVTVLQGVLVESLRKGYWIILDELNLAPSEVLHAMFCLPRPR